jgi:hypothetical protein
MFVTHLLFPSKLVSAFTTSGWQTITAKPQEVVLSQIRNYFPRALHKSEQGGD